MAACATHEDADCPVHGLKYSRASQNHMGMDNYGLFKQVRNHVPPCALPLQAVRGICFIRGPRSKAAMAHAYSPGILNINPQNYYTNHPLNRWIFKASQVIRVALAGFARLNGPALYVLKSVTHMQTYSALPGFCRGQDFRALIRVPSFHFILKLTLRKLNSLAEICTSKSLDKRWSEAERFAPQGFEAERFVPQGFEGKVKHSYFKKKLCL